MFAFPQPLRLLCALFSGTCTLLFATPTAHAEEKYTVTVYQLWGSDGVDVETAEKLPKKMVAELRKHTKKKRFRLATKEPHVQKISFERGVSLELPDHYQARWELETHRQSVRLKQTLVNKKRKRKATLLLKETPAIISLAKIRRDDEVFVLLVDLKTASSGATAK